MIASGSFHVGNGIFFLKDSGQSLVAVPDGNGIFFANATSISVLAKHEEDGSCRISLGPMSEVALDREPDFYRTIDVPTSKVVVMLVPRVEVLSLRVSASRIGVCIWLNDPHYADEIMIGVTDSL
jgi:hypothetical protein